MKIGVAGENTHSAHILTDSDASAAHDAEAVIAIKERLSQDRHILKRDIVSDPFQPDEPHCLLQLTFFILGAVLAAHSDREFAHAFAQIVAFVFPVAKKAAGGVIGESEEHLQGVSSHLLQFIGPGLHHHSFFC
jgi:hypothetical protein